MSHRWTNHSSNFYQGNQLSYTNPNNENQNTKAYLNPQIVNCELIKKKLTKNSLQRTNKIHVNPNFKGNGMNNLSNGNYPHLINVINSQDSLLNKPGTSNPSSSGEKLNSLIPSLNGCEKNFNSAAPLKSRFKKINAVNPKNNKSSYMWAKNTSNFNSLNTVSYNANKPGGSNIKSGLGASKSLNYNRLKYKYTSPTKVWQISNEACESDKSHLIYKSKTKLLRKNPSPKSKTFVKELNNLHVKKQLNLSKFANNKKSSISRVAKAVRNKYIYLNNLEQFKKSKYKIDKRNKLPETVKKSTLNKCKDIRKLFPNYFYNKAKLSSYNVYNISSCKARSTCLWRKNQHFNKVTQKIINNKFPNRTVVKIGGILYKSTTNKLTLANKKHENNPKKVMNNITKGKKNYILYVRGEKFILEKNGKALKRQTHNVTDEKTPLLTPKRIDIGGVTYVKKSENVLIRTNVHQARYLVNKAKNKSIALLTSLRKRSSMPCMIYHRFGRCKRHTEGLCMYKHDPKNITVCKKFLKGVCTNENCLLSHQVVQEKMATCLFFLKGLCVRENCPYLHVKLNKNAGICKNFLQGFCSLGKECTKKHLHQCPKFDKNGTCDLGSKCPYPHKELKKTENLTENTNVTNDGNEKVQYYIHSKIQRKPKKIKRPINRVKESTDENGEKGSKEGDVSLLGESSKMIQCLPKRIKLDKLPCFIPLNSDS